MSARWKYVSKNMAGIVVSGFDDMYSLLDGSSTLTRLPSGEWVPDLAPHNLRWVSAEVSGVNPPPTGEFPEVPWYPDGSNRYEGENGDLYVMWKWRRCVPASRDAAGWPPVKEISADEEVVP